MTFDVRPERTSYRPGDPVVLLVDSSVAQRVSLVVTRLGLVEAQADETVGMGRSRVTVGDFAEASYAMRLTAADGSTATGAFDVTTDPMARPRYGFVTDFVPGRHDDASVADSLRAFHINAVQFYDWMYRHAALLPPPEDADGFVDALDRSLSLETVRRLVDATHTAGARAIAYAAVYGAGHEYARSHPDEVLHHRDGRPWQLGDFLWIMDVSRGSAWSAHVVAEMAAAVAAVGFDGLHLDQYGDPKIAVTTSGTVVDLAEGFVALIEAVRARLPDATLIFNNVNDFPTATTVRAPQDVTYIEVWSPHDDYGDLVRLVDTARDRCPERAVVLAAYLEPFAQPCGPDQVAAAKLALSTVWSAGGQYLLFGERHGALTHPYYPNYATLTDDAVAVLRRFADFAVANGDVLFNPRLARSTRHLWRGVNEDVAVEGAPVLAEPTPGGIWMRIATDGPRLVVTLVDLTGQADPRWNVAKRPTDPAPRLRVRVRVASAEPSVRFGHPLAGPELAPIPLSVDGEHVDVEIPPFDTWAVVVVDR
jgi:dextranase